MVNVDFSESDLSGIHIDRTSVSDVNHIEFIKSALNSHDPITRGTGVDATVVLAEQHPSQCGELVDPLVEVINEVQLPSVQATAVRALSIFVPEIDSSIHRIDTLFADLLRNGSELTRETIVTDGFTIVSNQPQHFSKTIAAYEEAINDGNKKVQSAAIKALAIIASDVPELIDDLDSLIAQLEQVRHQSKVSPSTVNQALNIISKSNSGKSLG